MSLAYRLQDLSFRYGDSPLLEGLNLEIHAGDFIGVMGANGSGKTTLVRLLAGYLKAAQGSIELEGAPLQGFSARERARKIAVVPQNFDVLFPFSVKEVVLMGRWAYLKPMAWESERDLEIAQESMRLADCLHFQDRSVTELSGGEKERVLLARALAQEARVLLLDEPTTHLDLQHQVETFRLLKRLHAQKRFTLVTVLHDLNFAARACEKILLLQKGKPAKFGSVEDVLSPSNVREAFGASLQVLQQGGQNYYLPQMDLQDASDG